MSNSNVSRTDNIVSGTSISRSLVQVPQYPTNLTQQTVNNLTQTGQLDHLIGLLHLAHTAGDTDKVDFAVQTISSIIQSQLDASHSEKDIDHDPA